MQIIRKLLQKETAPSMKSLDENLQLINERIASIPPAEIPLLLGEIPIDAFGNLLLDVPSKLPNIKAFFPSMPPDDIQDKWTGNHGARNLKTKAYSGFLENYPDRYKTWIVNALYLPSCEDAPLTQDMDPINTFPIVFNCYFDANIPLK